MTRGDVERSVEHLDAVPAFLLGTIHRDIAIAEQRTHLVAVIGKDRDADRGADEYPMPGYGDWIGHRRDDPLSKGRRASRIEVGDPQSELVAAHSRDHRVAAQTSQQPLRDREQQPIAGSVAERVVDILEMIEVEV